MNRHIVGAALWYLSLIALMVLCCDLPLGLYLLFVLPWAFFVGYQGGKHLAAFSKER